MSDNASSTASVTLDSYKKQFNGALWGMALVLLAPVLTGALIMTSEGGVLTTLVFGLLVGALGAGLLARRFTRQMVGVLDETLQSEQVLRRLMELSGDWYWTQNQNHQITRILYKGVEQGEAGQTAYLPFTGLTRWEVPGLHLLTRDMTWDGFRALLNSHQPFDRLMFSYQPVDGLRMVFESTGRPVWSADRQFLGYEGVSTNITQKVLNERLLALERHLLQGVLLSAPLGELARAYTTGLKNCLTLDCELLLGYREHAHAQHWSLRGAPSNLRLREMQSKALWDNPMKACLPMDGVEHSGLIQVVRLREDWVPDHWKSDLDIKRVWLAMRKASEPGQPEYWMMVAQRTDVDPPKEDVTRLLAALRLLGLCLERRVFEDELQTLNNSLEQRIAERTQELTQANSELEAFTYTVSHDLRAPLRAIDGFSSILREDFKSQLPEDASGLLDRISNNARQMGGLIDGLLDFSRLLRTEVTRVEVDLGKLVQQVLDSLDAHRRAAIECPTLPVIQADPVLIQQVWMNLIDNALKFSSKVAQPRVVITCEALEAHWRFSVKDNGAGFDMKYADKLFNVFERLHHKKDFDGTGVGLAIVKRIIERHGGHISAESAVGEGACFVFTLSR